MFTNSVAIESYFNADDPTIIWEYHDLRSLILNRRKFIRSDYKRLTIVDLYDPWIIRSVQVGIIIQMIISEYFYLFFLFEKDFLFFGIVIKDCFNIFKNAALKKLSIRFRSIDLWDNLFRLLMIIYSPRSWISWFWNCNDNREKYDFRRNDWRKMILPLLFDVENLVVDQWTLVERFHYWKMLNR